MFPRQLSCLLIPKTISGHKISLGPRDELDYFFSKGCTLLFCRWNSSSTEGPRGSISLASEHKPNGLFQSATSTNFSCHLCYCLRHDPGSDCPKNDLMLPENSYFLLQWETQTIHSYDMYHPFNNLSCLEVWEPVCWAFLIWNVKMNSSMKITPGHPKQNWFPVVLRLLPNKGGEKQLLPPRTESWRRLSKQWGGTKGTQRWVALPWRLVCTSFKE